MSPTFSEEMHQLSQAVLWFTKMQRLPDQWTFCQRSDHHLSSTEDLWLNYRLTHIFCQGMFMTIQKQEGQSCTNMCRYTQKSVDLQTHLQVLSLSSSCLDLQSASECLQEHWHVSGSWTNNLLLLSGHVEQQGSHWLLKGERMREKEKDWGRLLLTHRNGHY